MWFKMVQHSSIGTNAPKRGQASNPRLKFSENLFTKEGKNNFHILLFPPFLKGARGILVLKKRLFLVY